MNISKFLSMFGTPGVRMIYEKDKKQQKSTNIMLSEKRIIELNKEGYGAFFTPNGNYGEGLKEGDKLNIKKTEGRGYHTLRVDLDFDVDTPQEEKIKFIKDITKKYNFTFSFAVGTGKGFHLYWLLDDEAKQYITDDAFTKIEKFLNNTIFTPYGDDSNSVISKLLRIPFTYRWKKGQRKVELFDTNFNKIENLDDDIIKNFRRFDRQNIDVLLKNIDYFNKAAKTDKEGQKKIGGSIQNIKFPDLFKVLKKYPKTYNGKTYYFTIDSSNKVLINYLDGTTYTPDGYFYNDRENYINNFSMSLHNIDERPRGPVLAFLYYYFDRSWSNVKKFLAENFGYELDDKGIVSASSIQEKGQLVWKNENETVSIYYVPGRGVYKVSIAKEIVKVDTLLEGDLEFVSINKIYKDDRLGTKFKEPQLRYIIRYDDKYVLIPPKHNKNEFNKLLSGMGLRWLGTDNDLLLLYNWLDKQIQLYNRYRIFEETGFNNGNWIFGNKIIKGNVEEDYKIISQRNVVLLNNNFKYGKIVDLGKKYDDYWQYGRYMFTLYFTLLGANKIIDYRRTKSYIGTSVGVFGTTTLGKTTSYQLLFRSLGVDVKAMVRSIALTPQPLKSYATDYTVGILEEFTGRNIKGKEDILRDIISANTAEIGTPGRNDEFVFNSPLILIGEDEPVERSLINRLALIILDEKDIIDIKKDPYEGTKINILDDAYNFWNNIDINEDEIQDIYKEAKAMGVAGRYIDTYVLFSYVGNKLGLIKPNEFFETAGIMLGRIGYSITDTVKSTNYFAFLDKMIAKSLTKKTVSIQRQLLDDVNDTEIYTISFWGDDVARNKRHFVGLKDFGFNVEIDGEDIDLTIKIDPTDNSSKAKGVRMFFDQLNQKYQKNITVLQF